MTTISYIRLGQGTTDKRFRVLYASDGFVPATIRQRQLRFTANGKVDIQHGAHYRAWQLMCRVNVEETDVNFGNMDYLEGLLDHNTPDKDALTFYDPLGDKFTVYIDVDTDPQMMTPMLDGHNAYFIVPLLLRESTLKTTFYYSDFSGLQLLLRADRGTYKDAGLAFALDGETVQQWNDQSGKGRNATQATVAARGILRAAPTGFNGRAALQLDGTNDFYNLAGLASDYLTAGAKSFLVVTRYSTLVDNAALFNCGTNDRIAIRQVTGPLFRIHNDDGAADTASVSVVANTTYLWEAWHSAGTIQTRVNGGTAVSTASGNTTDLSETVKMGTNAGQSAFWTGHIAEMAIYNTDIGAAARTSWRTYAAAKYGVTLP